VKSLVKKAGTRPRELPVEARPSVFGTASAGLRLLSAPLLPQRSTTERGLGRWARGGVSAEGSVAVAVEVRVVSRSKGRLQECVSIEEVVREGLDT
jgi:hypothetical protein